MVSGMRTRCAPDVGPSGGGVDVNLVKVLLPSTLDQERPLRIVSTGISTLVNLSSVSQFKVRRLEIRGARCRVLGARSSGDPLSRKTRKTKKKKEKKRHQAPKRFNAEEQEE